MNDVWLWEAGNARSDTCLPEAFSRHLREDYVPEWLVDYAVTASGNPHLGPVYGYPPIRDHDTVVAARCLLGGLEL